MKLALLTDTHLTGRDTWHQELSVPGVAYFDPRVRTEGILAGIAEERPDLVVHLGDFVHERDVRMYSHFDHAYAQLLNQTPLLPVVGNHDLTKALKDEVRMTDCSSAMHEREVLSYHVALVDGWHLISVDANCGYESKSKATDVGDDSHRRLQRATVEWLEGELDSIGDDRHVIICTHFPTRRMSEELSGYRPHDFGGELMHVLRRHDQKIKVVLHGHIHREGQYDDQDSRLTFRSLICGSYPLAPQERVINFQASATVANSDRRGPRSDPTDKHGYEILELFTDGCWNSDVRNLSARYSGG